MANTRISNLTASASNLASTDLAPVVQTVGVGPVKMTGLQLAGGLLGSTTFNGATSAGTALSTVAITGTGGQFSCAAATLVVGQNVTISGTLGGTGSITGYSSPTTYTISSTNGSTTFTLVNGSTGAALTTTAGTPTGLTYVVTSPIVNFTQTWNNSNVTFTGLKFNATDTASASGSLLLDLQVGGASRFKTDKTGAFYFGSVSGAKFLDNYDNTTGDLFAKNEVVLQNTATSANTLSLQNLSSSGYSALEVRDNNNVARLAVGYGNSASSVSLFANTNYIESWTKTGAPPRLVIAMDGDYGTVGSGYRFYQRQSFETDGDVKFWKLIPNGTTQVEGLVLKSNGTVYIAADATTDNNSIFKIRADSTTYVSTAQSFSNLMRLEQLATTASAVLAYTSVASTSTDGLFRVDIDNVSATADGLTLRNRGTGAGVRIEGSGGVAFLAYGGSKDLFLTRAAARTLSIRGASSTPGIVTLGAYSAAGTAITSASTAGAGAIAFASDATATTPRSTYASGGSNFVMLMSDGTNWLIVA